MPALDLWPLLEQLQIRTKQGKQLFLRRDDPFAWAQREFVREIEWQYNHGLPVRLIVLKGRQLGISTLTEAILFLWAFIHPGTNSLVLSKERGDSEYLFGMTRLYWELGPFKGAYTTRSYQQGYIEWNAINSSVIVETAGKADPGRGKTIQAAHCSEVAFWEDRLDVSGLTESIPRAHGTIMVLESTAKGVGGYFYDEWEKARNREGQFTAMFFPWFLHHEYEIPETGLSMRDLTPDEHELMALYPEITLPKLAWRREKIAGMEGGLEKFKEEYPCCPEEAFRSTGSNVFDLDALEECYSDTPYTKGYLVAKGNAFSLQEDHSGHLWVYTPPVRNHEYVVVVDPTWTITGDPACVQILDRAEMDQVAVWHGRATPETVAAKALEIAYWYNNALLNTEVQGGGTVIIDVWKNNDYQNIWVDRRSDRIRGSAASFGFMSTYQNKSHIIALSQGFVKRRSLAIHHRPTYHEMRQYIRTEDEYGPARRSGHDDCVTSLMIAIWTAVSEQRNLNLQQVYSDGFNPDPSRAMIAGSMNRPPVMATLMDDYGDVEDWY